jgi:glycosyltransferase involved in cell wall biosynthesis
MKKVLIIPSWYPTEKSPYMGIFFKVQTELMMSDFDMKVLIGKANLYGKKTFFKYLINNRIQKINNHFIQTDYIESFEYKQASFYSFKKQLEISAEAYWTVTQKYLLKKKWKPDIIHAHDIFWGGYYANYIAKKLNIPSVITHHNPLIFNNYTKSQKELLKQTLESANQLLCVSNFDKRTFLISDFDCKPEFVGNFVDEDKFKLKSHEQKEKEVFNIFTVGIASKRKDFPTLLKAIRYLVYDLNLKDIKITLNISDKVADGISLENIKQLAVDLKINQYCNFVNNLSLDDLICNYQKADVFTSSSYFETFGVAVCEAMCCGTPVVAINNGGIDDIINSENGIRIPIGDHVGMAQAILKIKNKEIVFNKEKVRESIISKYGRLAFFNRISNIYNKS